MARLLASRYIHIVKTMFKIPIHSLFSKKTEDPDRDAAGIPYTSGEDIRALRLEYEHKTREAEDPGLEACFKYVEIFLVSQRRIHALIVLVHLQLLLGFGSLKRCW